MPRRLIALTSILILTAAASGPPAAASGPPAAASVPPEPPAGAVPPVGSGEWSPPVSGPIVRRFQPPARPFGRRHLGLDFAVPPGTPVRAVADGVVAFAGRTGHAWAVGVAHLGGGRSTYAYLRTIRVSPGSPVRRGAVLGESGGVGPGHGNGVVHLGYRVNDRPADPAALFDFDSLPRISLAPLDRPACSK